MSSKGMKSEGMVCSYPAYIVSYKLKLHCTAVPLRLEKVKQQTQQKGARLEEQPSQCRDKLFMLSKS